MSKGKVAYDNAVMESFFSTLKKELMRGQKKFEDLQEAQLKIFEYIEIYYNKKRIQSTLGIKVHMSTKKK
ncbi:MAG: IS3 family transposase [Verrucomicrobia bacterium]|nr:IS3 family transposase [Verrucomicrobiota bacterium]